MDYFKLFLCNITEVNITSCFEIIKYKNIFHICFFTILYIQKLHKIGFYLNNFLTNILGRTSKIETYFSVVYSILYMQYIIFIHNVSFFM